MSMPVQLKDLSWTQDRRLDRVKQFDEKSKRFNVADQIAPALSLRSYTWKRGAQLNQGEDGACVGFGHMARRGARPVPTDVDDAQAFDVYHMAQNLDEWPGNDYSGTSVLAGAKAMTQLGYYSRYDWAFNIDDILMGIGHHGPAVFGLSWKNTMFTPDQNGLLDISGADAGGHCICGYAVWLRKTPWGFKLPEPAVGLVQSWGPDWGIAGGAIILASKLETLMKDGGECLFPTELKAKKEATK
jgi:hypothetical protein